MQMFLPQLYVQNMFKTSAATSHQVAPVALRKL
jgi:hypothetical protein